MGSDVTMRCSKAMLDAMKLVRSGMTPYRAAKQANIALSTMYRSPLYKDWRDSRGKSGVSVKQRTDK